jgi:hypothetical protein
MTQPAQEPAEAPGAARRPPTGPGAGLVGAALGVVSYLLGFAGTPGRSTPPGFW